MIISQNLKCKHRMCTPHLWIFLHMYACVWLWLHVCVYVWASFHMHPVSGLCAGCLMKFETWKSRHNLLSYPSVFNKWGSWKSSARICSGEKLQDAHSHKHRHVHSHRFLTDMSPHMFSLHSQYLHEGYIYQHTQMHTIHKQTYKLSYTPVST